MASSRYWELSLAVPDDVSEAVTNLVWELGALGVVEEAAPEAAPRLRAFFPETATPAVLAARVRDYLASLRTLGFAADGEPRVEDLADGDWAMAWRAYFKPVAVGRGLVIAPPWERPPADGRLVITVEPGRAFGTGQHGSTAGCLELVEARAGRHPVARAIDIGTGSGVLAIALARLGVPSVLAVDDDPDAVAAAVANAARNRVCDRVRCVLVDARTLAAEPAPLVVANLLAAAHRVLGACYARHVTPGGVLVLGGMLDGEADEVAGVLTRRGFVRAEAVSRDGWTSLALVLEPPRAPLHDLA
jgi:ribosomal protein L11 methyltransferase